MCVHVDREVPAELRCSPGGGSVNAGGTGSSPDCPCGGQYDTADLVRRVTDALRHGLGQWIQRGAVVIDL
jgi:hypothetical protein